MDSLDEFLHLGDFLTPTTMLLLSVFGIFVGIVLYIISPMEGNPEDYKPNKKIEEKKEEA
jgi:hypothetical protein